MNAFSLAPLINLLGFAVGCVLYALLLAMTVRHRARSDANNKFKINKLLLTTAILGLVWNLGELIAFGVSDFNPNLTLPPLRAVAHAALGFLPAVVVHSVCANFDEKTVARRLLIGAAYSISGAATILQLQSAFWEDLAPSLVGLQLLIVGYLAVLAALLIFAFRQTLEQKTVWAAALAIFAVSVAHLSVPHDVDSFWLIELVGHQASLPLAAAVLLQNFRFAFADLFLKRALSLFLLSLSAFALYAFAAQPLIALHQNHSQNDLQPILILLGAWIATALFYPLLHRFAVWTIDKIVLRRQDYQKLRLEIAAQISAVESAANVLDKICQSLQMALTANQATWSETRRGAGENHFPVVSAARNAVEISIATAEAPFYQIALAEFAGGRKLLSDEIEMLQDAAAIAARRIDALRVSRERFEQTFRQQETVKLAMEAELRALRAQLNPHFLFNALTTIGYLVQTAPDKAFDTLLKLSELLRAVLGATTEFSHEFCTLADEIKLIEAYLEIERARFEERLTIDIKIAPELLKLLVPSLILQPLIENAIKHGVTAKKEGGAIAIRAIIENHNLILEVRDTGAGFDESSYHEKPVRGIGLSNVEARLRAHFEENARLIVQSKIGAGTTARIILPLPTTGKSVARG